jgi:hypothetical protein
MKEELRIFDFLIGDSKRSAHVKNGIRFHETKEETNRRNQKLELNGLSGGKACEGSYRMFLFSTNEPIKMRCYDPSFAGFCFR